MGRNTDLKENYNYIAPGQNDVILPTSAVRDLGVIMNDQLNYSDHIAKVVSKVSQRVGLMLRKFSNRSTDFMKFIWKTYIQPLIDYSSQLYAPIGGGALMKMESLLESFTAKIKGMRSIGYWDRLKS